MRLMSFAATTEQFRDGSKSVTRRCGWTHARAGQRVLAVEKARAVRVEDRVELGIVEFVDVRREPLEAITAEDVVAEGFPGMTPEEFVTMFCRLNRCERNVSVTRIVFRRVEREGGLFE